MLMFEAGMSSSPSGSLNLFFDMHASSIALNMDLKAIKECVDILGTVYAECINMVVIIDFSWAAQTLWRMLKPLLTESTKRKIAFVSRQEAINLAKTMYDTRIFHRICSSIDMDRNRNATKEERLLHARQTAEPVFPFANEEFTGTGRAWLNP